MNKTKKTYHVRIKLDILGQLRAQVVGGHEPGILAWVWKEGGEGRRVGRGAL